MANLEQFNKDQEELLKRLDFDIPAVREAEKSGLSVVLMDPPSKIRVTPSAVRTVWFAIHGRDGACEWHSLAYFWKPGQLILAEITSYTGEKVDINSYYGKEFIHIIYLYPYLEQASLTKVPRSGNCGADYVYLYVYIISDRSLSLRGGNPWPSGYPIPVQDEDKIRKRILELESKTHLID